MPPGARFGGGAGMITGSFPRAEMGGKAPAALISRDRARHGESLSLAAVRRLCVQEDGRGGAAPPSPNRPYHHILSSLTASRDSFSLWSTSTPSPSPSLQAVQPPAPAVSGLTARPDTLTAP